jgi:hypothetical protein
MGLRRWMISLLTDGGLDAATLRQWADRRPQVIGRGGVVGVLGDASVAAEINWEYAAEMVNRRIR